jgi:hypothetical protein
MVQPADIMTWNMQIRGAYLDRKIIVMGCMQSDADGTKKKGRSENAG